MLKKSILILALFIISFISPAAYSFQITSLTLYTDDNGGTTSATTWMTPDDEMTLAIDTDAESLSSLTVTIYNSVLTTESGCYNTDTRISADRCAWLEWKNNSGESLLADIRPTQTSWLLDKSGSVIDPSGTSKIVFTPAKSSRYSSDSSWLISVTAEDSNSSASYNISLNNTYYIGIDPSRSSVSFEPGRAGTSSHPLSAITSSGYQKTNLPVSIISNAPYTWELQSIDFTGSSGIPLSGNNLVASLTDSVSSGTYLNTSYQTFGSSDNPTKESGDTKNIFMWLNYPSDDPDTTYLSRLYLRAYITSNPSYITSEYNVSLNATTDNTAPSILVLSPSPLSWSKSGNIISYNLNLADNLAGFMDSLSTMRCHAYFDGSEVSSAYVYKSSDYKSCSCSGSFTVPETGNKNINLNFTVTDMSGNLAYNDSLWLQIDLSSLYISDISLISTPKPYDLDWYFLPSDTFRIIGRVKNNVNDSVTSTLTSYLGISSGSCSINSVSSTASSPYEQSTSGNIDLEYDYSGAGVGDSHIFIDATDVMNNTIHYNRTIHITNYLESVYIINNFTGRIYTEGDNISVEFGTNLASTPVYLANLTAVMTNNHGSVIDTIDMNTASNGRSSHYFYIPEEPMEHYTITVTGFSPLDTSVLLTNYSVIDTEWLDITVNTDSVGYIENGTSQKISVWGSIYYSDDLGNETLVEGARVTCYMEGPGIYNQTCDTSLDEFGEYDCNCLENVTIPGRYDIEVSAEKSIFENTIRGWNKEEYVELTGISDISFQPTDTVVSDSYCVDLGGVPDMINMTRDSFTEFNVTVRNICDADCDVRLDITAPDRIDTLYGVDYSRNPMYVPADGNGTISIVFTAGQMPYGTHNLSFSAVCGDYIDRVSFLIAIIPTDDEISQMLSSYISLQDNVAFCHEKLNALDSSDNILLNPLRSKLSDADEMLIELKGYLDSGSYAAAESYIVEIGQKLDGLESELDNNLDAQNDTRIKNILLAVLVVLLISLGILIWYMWLPEKSTDYKFGGSGKSSAHDSCSGSPLSRSISGIIGSIRHKLGFGKNGS